MRISGTSWTRLAMSQVRSGHGAVVAARRERAAARTASAARSTVLFRLFAIRCPLIRGAGRAPHPASPSRRAGERADWGGLKAEGWKAEG